MSNNNTTTAVPKPEVKPISAYETHELATLSKEDMLKAVELERKLVDLNNSMKNVGISRTQAGELMVVVSPDRWPVTLGRTEWENLLNKADIVRAALKTLGIRDLSKEERKAIKAEKAASKQSA